MISFETYPSPIGTLTVAATEESIVQVLFADSAPPPSSWERRDTELTQEAIRQLKSYFAGTLKSFDLPLFFSGTTFQKRVLNALQDIGYGHTRSYKQIAASIGRPTACRAVGSACGYNPIPILIPCHRVLTHDRKIGGFGGGLQTKRALLTLEGVQSP